MHGKIFLAAAVRLNSLTMPFSFIFLVEPQFGVSQAHFQLILVTWKYCAALRKTQTLFFSSASYVFVACSTLHAFE